MFLIKAARGLFFSPLQLFLRLIPLLESYYLQVSLEMRFGCSYTISSILSHCEACWKDLDAGEHFFKSSKYLVGILIYFIAFFQSWSMSALEESALPLSDRRKPFSSVRNTF